MGQWLFETGSCSSGATSQTFWRKEWSLPPKQYSDQKVRNTTLARLLGLD